MNQHRSSVLCAIAVVAAGLSTAGAATAAPDPAETGATPFFSEGPTARAEGAVFRLSVRQASARIVRVSGASMPDSRVRLRVERPDAGVDIAVVKTTASGRFAMSYPRIREPGRYTVTATFLANARYARSEPSTTSFRVR